MTARTKFEAFLSDDHGGATAEYALILAIVGLGVIVALAGLRKTPPAAPNASPAPPAAPAR